MATDYPGALDSLTNPAGTQTLDDPDHALQHTNANDAIEAAQVVVGTTAGTNVLKAFAEGDIPARLNTSNVLQQVIQGTLGTSSIVGGTVSEAVVGTCAVTGGTVSGAVLSATSGTLNGLTLGTPIMDEFTTSATTVPSLANRALAPTVGTITDVPSGTLASNAPSANIFELNLGTTAGNRTLAAPTNLTDGQSLTYRVKQNAGNTGTLVWNAIFRESTDTGTPALGTEATFNYYGWRYNDTDTKLDFIGQSKNII